MDYLIHQIFSWIAASSAGIPADKLNGIKTILADGVSTFLINGKPAVINRLIKFKNPLSWLVTFLVVPFNKIPLFSKDLFTFIISFILLFVRVILETVNHEIPFLTCLPIKLSPESIKISLFSFLTPLFFILIYYCWTR